MKKWLIPIVGWLIFASTSYAGIFSAADAKTTAFKDPDYKDYKIIKVMITIPGLDLDSRAKSEKTFVEKFTEARTASKTIFSKKAAIDVTAVSSLDILLPTRKYTQDEFEALIKEHEIDSILLIKVTAQYSDEIYMPESSYTTETGNVYGNVFNSFSTTVTSGGYSFSYPKAKMDLKLYDTITGKTIWMANAFASGNEFANFNSLMKSVAKETITKLTEADLVKPIEGE